MPYINNIIPAIIDVIIGKILPENDIYFIVIIL